MNQWQNYLQRKTVCQKWSRVHAVVDTCLIWIHLPDEIGLAMQTMRFIAQKVAATDSRFFSLSDSSSPFTEPQWYSGRSPTTVTCVGTPERLNHSSKFSTNSPDLTSLTHCNQKMEPVYNLKAKLSNAKETCGFFCAIVFVHLFNLMLFVFFSPSQQLHYGELTG